jgi:cytochrome P450
MKPRAAVTDWVTDFDPLDPCWVQDPYAIIGELRQKCPIAHTERFRGVYLPLRDEDIRAVAYDPEHFSSRRLFLREEEAPLTRAPPITSDPPSHRAERKMLLPPFTPAAVAKLEPWTRALCRSLIESVSGNSTCDGACNYAQEISTRLTAHMLGLPEEMGDQFRIWVHGFFDLAQTDLAALQRVMAELNEFFGGEIAKRRQTPGGDDLVSYLIDARIDGELISDDDIKGTLRLLLFAGIDTTWSAIGTSLWHLATHDGDRKRLAAEPHLIPTAIEEFLRAYAPATVGREIVKETEIGGCRFKEGQMVLLPFAAANRDPDAFPDPDRVVIDRVENRHAAFGLGIHRCIGSNLARMEMRVAIEEWLLKFPDFVLTPGAVVEWSAGAVRGPRRLPLTLTPMPNAQR